MSLSISKHERVIVIGNSKTAARMTKLIEHLMACRLPVPMRSLAELLECDAATVKRMVRHLVHNHQLPIVSSRSGYAWRPPVVAAPVTQLQEQP